MPYAHLMHSAGSLEHRRGRYPKAYTHFEQVLAIRKKHARPGTNELANAYSGMTMALVGLYRGNEAINFANSAISVFQDKSEEEKLAKFNVDRYLRNRGRAFFYMGKFEESKADVIEAAQWATKIYGPNSHYHGE
jgi:tetratricopeptide (TPR) repeat protein